MTATPTRFIRASIVNEGKVEVGDVLIARVDERPVAAARERARGAQVAHEGAQHAVGLRDVRLGLRGGALCVPVPAAA